MSRILFSWELGANYGHLSRDLPVAERLRSAGHNVIFAVSDIRIATELLSPQHFDFVQAPYSRRTAKLIKPPANYAELLLAENWGDHISLQGLVQAWLSLFSLLKIDLVVGDHSPSALLSAHIAEIPRIAFGNGFEIPPSTYPLPSIRPWERIPTERLIASEKSVLNIINCIIIKYKKPPFKHVANIFPKQAILTTFPELDHYLFRENGVYIGSIHGSQNGIDINWQSKCGRRVLAYLRSNQPTTKAVLSALSEINRATSIIAVPDAEINHITEHTYKNIKIVSSNINFFPLLKDTEVFISYGGNGTIAEALLSGVPLLMIPQTVEQYQVAMRVEALGAGIVLQQNRGKDEIHFALEALLDKPEYQLAAKNFSTKYQRITPEHAAKNAAELIISISQLIQCNTEINTIQSLISDGF